MIQKLDKDGNIPVAPLVGAGVHLLYGMTIVMKMQYVESEQELRAVVAGEKAPEFHLLSISASQARLLAQDLLQKADEAEQSPKQ